MDRDSRSTSPWEYLDFELEVREGSQGKYSVCVLRSPAGEPQEEMRFPFDDERELAKKLEELEEALYRSSDTRSATKRRRIHSSEERTVQDFGRRLFGALIDGEVRACYRMSLDKAKQQNKGLRLKLRVQPPELAQLPWEFLYDPGRDEYLCLSSKRPLVRYLNLPQPVEPLVVEPPLKILGMVASPSDLPDLDVENEKRRVEEAIKSLRANGMVELTWLEGETCEDLEQAMWGGPWHVFHFVGHGSFNPFKEEGAIALADEECRTHLLTAKNLATLLMDQYPLRLVFLNSCEGAKGGEGDAFSSAAATLVRRGVPAVVAMQYEITDEAAISFARAFYRAVAQGLPVDAAVAVGRTSLSNKIDDTLEWGTPVLYMRSPDGRVFDILKEESEVVIGNLQWGMHGAEPISEEPKDRGEEELRRSLEELYSQARRLHRDQEWQLVVDVFDEIQALDPVFLDREGLLVSAREALIALGLARRIAAIYDQGLRHVEAEEWSQALRCFEEIQQLEPGYRKIEALLSRVRHELTGGAEQERHNDKGQEHSRNASGSSSARPRFLPGEQNSKSDSLPGKQKSKLDKPRSLPGW